MKQSIRVKLFDALGTISRQNHAKGIPDLYCGERCCRVARNIDWLFSLKED